MTTDIKELPHMKLLVFGSVNIDHVYQLPHFVREGETLASAAYHKNEGGKGTNQAIALAKAGMDVWFAGAIGQDGLFMRDYLKEFGINTEELRVLDVPTGHAVIQVNAKGENSIILYGGANQKITPSMISETLEHFSSSDCLLMQNEISCGKELLEAAAEKGLFIVLNPSPVSEQMLSWPLHLVDLFILNEVEGKDLTGEIEPERILDVLTERYPKARIVLTLGSQGSVYASGRERMTQHAFTVPTVDTTAAGDTFTGYFLSSLLKEKNVGHALFTASVASSITVTRHGAGRSIPGVEEVQAACDSKLG